MNFVAIEGTNADFSYNRFLLHYIRNHFVSKHVIEVCEIANLPVFNADLDVKKQPVVLELAKRVEKSDGVIIATPEYDHSIPAVLKSTIEWLSYQLNSFSKKPVFIIGASYGPQGSARAQLHLRQILSSPDVMANVLPGNEFLLGNVTQQFDDEQNLKDAAIIEKLEVSFNDFITYTSTFKK
ncbi:NADPH-dependent FMN reductase [Tetragenococcus koreensis]|uniref:NADPH-dependent FMN reductase n=1 Tax=Tetragenococcus koreensis TaxID=290335 RepID=UPI000F510C7F|nr:NADPH-dependent FMN reductase [Tetragenococcus koreensis]MDN6409193.1 NAD(P)H-dependent oxidoreductase [Tetragenococcus halophilus]MDN6641103.1 NAD(P)H-dependent oxidoreductase [Tetragenococcus sp.]AYW44905.1 NADPH-dependent FMN reductase [Tetragenococcus koreensis]MCF1627876.1 NAD(P)H-dependent oxidoreductase [Tetragenococcus koreensis]MCF1632781.1 NAD(P)H-dependent oxidoreductase [Tetragenococcus koreensis]